MISRQHFLLKSNRNKGRLNFIKGCSTLSFTNYVDAAFRTLQLVLKKAVIQLLN